MDIPISSCCCRRMPSACMKPEKKASVEVEDPIKQAINVVEKKVRNLEKRKGKLDEYKTKVKGGATLNSDQKQAVSRYDSVLSNLEFARELQKQFQEIQEKAEKLLKKKLKVEQKILHLEEVNRMQEVLRLQNLLDNMGSEEAREHFKTGKQGAVLLSEEKLSQLDELYKLISPTRDGETSYAEQLLAASEHIVNFLDGTDKEVAGTTYKQLKQLVGEINQCGYFDKAPQAEEEIEQTEETTEPEEPAVMEETHEEVEEPAAVTQQPIAPAPAPAQSMVFTEEPLPTQIQPPQAMVGSHAEQVQYGVEEESFFSTMEVSKPRAFTDIVSSVQGNFNFLQESEIESSDASAGAASAAHVDPAVVAARPMSAAQMTAAHQQQQQNDALAQSYGSQGGAYSAAATLQDQMAQLSTQPSSQEQEQQVSDSMQDSLSGSQSFRDSLVASQSQASQYGQSSYEPAPEQSWATAADQSWGSGTQEHSNWVEQTSSQSQSWAEQASGHSTHQPAWSTGANTQSMPQISDEPPARIPLPNETVPGQSLSGSAMNYSESAQSGYSQAAAESQEKKSQLNPNANIFMYSSQESGFTQSSDFEQRRSMSKEPGSYSHVDKEGFQTQGGYRGGQRDYRGSQRGGPGGGRGSRGGMNSYQRGGRGGGYGGGNRGGAGSYQNGSRGGRGGNGNYTNTGGSSAGQARFQGYPPRTDYQPEGGFQGSSPFTTSSSSLASSQLRFHSNEGSTPPGAGVRGGMRGGPRGGPRGGRGGNQGYGARPNSGQ